MKKLKTLFTFLLGLTAVSFGLLPAVGQIPAATIEVDARQALHRVSPYLTGACLEDVNHEVYGGIYSQMLYGEHFQEPSESGQPAGVSGQWRPVATGNAQAAYAVEKDHPWVGRQSQRVTFVGGTGSVGLENQGLNHEGLNFVAGKPYEGCVSVRTSQPTKLFVSLESDDGNTVFAESCLTSNPSPWQSLKFSLTPRAGDQHGRFVLRLREPGSLTIGYAFLEAGEWGRFKGLPVRRDIAEGLEDQGVTVLRYGGSMVNTPEYRWKKMIGPREQRSPYHGFWHPYSSNGWGIVDFLDLCEAAGFLAIPDFNIDESPQDMIDFVEYANGPATSKWGAQRVEAGHPAPYHLTHLELGNEERVDDKYWTKFQALATAIWAKDPSMILVVGDFAYQQPIADPFHFSGADSGISTLAAQQKILQLAKSHGREVWFDVHVWTAGPQPASSLAGAISFRDALAKIGGGAPFHVAVFELNANNHDQKRALANALAIQTFQRDGQFPVVCSANCLQPDGQNDNGWDQGLLFLNPSQVWLQPPGYVARMIARHFEPWLVASRATGAADKLKVDAERSGDSGTLVLKVINDGPQPVPAATHIRGFIFTKPTASVEEMAGALEGSNTAAEPSRFKPTVKEWRDNFSKGSPEFTFPGNSVTVITFQ